MPRRTFGRLRGVPQVSQHLLWRLRESRRSPGICFDVCGYSRKSRGICFDICGYSRKSPGICFDVCGESRKSPGICFGVCGESRKCFGELVGRYNMLSMTFSMNKGISFFRRTHVCLPSAEAFCCRPNYAAYSGHCAKPIEYLFGPRRPPPRPGKYAWYMMRWNFTSYPAKLCRRL